MYAIVAASKLKPGADPEMSQNILTGVSAAAGFINGAIAWSTDRERGRAMFLFDTAENARTALEQTLANMPADAPMEIEAVEVSEVVAHA